MSHEMTLAANQGSEKESLDSWKEIAAYLGRDVSTVQRWEQSRGLPIRRLQGGKRGAVYALKSELDAWKFQDRRATAAGENVPPTQPQATSPVPVEKPERAPVAPAVTRWFPRILGAAKPARIALVAAVILAAGGFGWKFGVWRSGAPLRFVPLASLPGEELHPALSPDGGFVAFSYGEGRGGLDLYVKAVGAGEPLRLTQNTQNVVRFPQWSPDSSHIAFLRSSNQEVGVWIIGASGGGQRKVATLNQAVAGPVAWSAAGDHLVLADVENRRGATSLYALNVSTGARTRLTFPPPDIVGDSDPAISPDGEWLAFTRQNPFMVKDIWVMRRRGGEPRRITSDRRNITGLAWLDDKSVLFISDRGGPGPAIWRIAAGGGNPRPIAYLPAHSGMLSVSPRSRRIAWANIAARSSIWRYSVDSEPGEPERLITSSAIQGHPQYSPDGSSIAFMSDRSGFMEIWVARSDGSDPRKLTQLHGVGGAPHWSPDGSSIAFDMRVNGNHGIFLVGADGGPVTRLLADSHENGSPSWSRDGRWVYFLSNRSGVHQVWKVATSGGPPAQVTRDGGHIPFESPDGTVLYFAKNKDGPGIWQKRLPDGEEVPVLPKYWGAIFGAWQITKEGICFIDRRPAGGAPVLKVQAYDTGATKALTSLRGAVFPAMFLGVAVHPMSVSPDDKFVLVTRLDQRQSNIMISEMAVR